MYRHAKAVVRLGDGSGPVIGRIFRPPGYAASREQAMRYFKARYVGPLINPHLPGGVGAPALIAQGGLVRIYKIYAKSTRKQTTKASPVIRGLPLKPTN